MSNFRIIVGDKYYMGETGEISDKFHDPWSTNSFHTSRVQRSILGFSDDPLDAKFIQDRTTLIGEARRIIEYLLYTDIGWRDIKIEGEPFAIPLKLNIDYFLDLERDASKMKAINTEMKKQLDISTDLGQKRFEENVALLARAEKAEAKVKELREELDKDNSYFEDIYTALEMEDFAPSCIPEINKLKGRNFELEQSVIELESSLAALKEATRWIPVGERLPEKWRDEDNVLILFNVRDRKGNMYSAYFNGDEWMDEEGNTPPGLFEITAWRPIDLPDADKESEEWVTK